MAFDHCYNTASGMGRPVTSTCFIRQNTRIMLQYRKRYGQACDSGARKPRKYWAVTYVFENLRHFWRKSCFLEKNMFQKILQNSLNPLISLVSRCPREKLKTSTVECGFPGPLRGFQFSPDLILQPLFYHNHFPHAELPSIRQSPLLTSASI